MVFISNNYDIPDYFNCRCDTLFRNDLTNIISTLRSGKGSLCHRRGEDRSPLHWPRHHCCHWWTIIGMSKDTIDDSQGILDDDHVDVAGVLPDVVHNFCHDWWDRGGWITRPWPVPLPSPEQSSPALHWTVTYIVFKPVLNIRLTKRSSSQRQTIKFRCVEAAPCHLFLLPPRRKKMVLTLIWQFNFKL